MSILDKLREAKIQGRLEESMFYEIVANEMEKGEYFKGLQTQAFAEAEGDERKAKALYMKLRVESLKDQLYVFEKEKSKPNKNDSKECSFKNEQTSDKNKIQKISRLEIVFVGLFFVVVIVFFYVTFAHQDTEVISYTKKEENTKNIRLPKKEMLKKLKNENFDFWISNIRTKYFVPMERDLFSETPEFSIYTSYSYNGFLTKKDKIFRANILLGANLYHDKYINSFEKESVIIFTEEMLSIYKSCYDTVKNTEDNYGCSKDFCSLMIGKIYKYFLADYDIQANKIALKWFQKSKSVSAYLNIAEYYELGIYDQKNRYNKKYIVIKKNIKKAKYWYKEAIKAGHKEAQKKLNLINIKN